MRTVTLVSSIAALSIASALTLPAIVAFPAIVAAQTKMQPAAQPAQTQIKVGDQVRTVSGGALMTVRAIQGGNATCEWQGENGALRTAAFPLNVLVAIGGPGTVAAPVTTDESQPYRPCPAEVVTAEGRHECIDSK